MKKLLLLSFAIIATAALQAHPNLDFVHETYNRATFNFQDFINAYKEAEKHVNEFTPQEQNEFKQMSKKAIDMIDKSMETKTDPVRSAEDSRNAINFHLNKAMMADEIGDTNAQSYHLNEATDLMLNDNNKIEPLQSREDDSIRFKRESDDFQTRAKHASENDGFDFAELGR